jgi:hypothetical protein
LIGWTSENKWYYGRRTAKGCHPSDLWKNYFTSSKEVKNFRNNHGDPDVIHIRRIFNNVYKCTCWENKVIIRIKAPASNNWLNLADGNGNWDSTGKVRYINPITKEIGIIDKDDPKIGKDIYRLNDYACAAYSDGISLGMVHRGDHRWTIGEIKTTTIEMALKSSMHNKGKCCAKDSTTGESLGKLSVNDPRWGTGEIVSSQLGKCIETATAMYRATGESCGRVDISDPRWETGEIVGYNTNRAAARNSITKEPLGMIDLDDPRWKSNEIESVIKGINLGLLPVIDAVTREWIGMLPKDDPKILSGEYIHNLTNNSANTVPARNCITGECEGRVSKDDPRWKTGEIISSTKFFNLLKGMITYIHVKTNEYVRVSIEDAKNLDISYINTAELRHLHIVDNNGTYLGKTTLEDHRFLTDEIFPAKGYYRVNQIYKCSCGKQSSSVNFLSNHIMKCHTMH